MLAHAYNASGGAKGATPPPDKSKEKLTQLNSLFQRGELEPDDYIRLRKSLLDEKSVTALEVQPRRKGFHLLLVERSMFSKKVRTFPRDRSCWRRARRSL